MIVVFILLMLSVLSLLLFYNGKNIFILVSSFFKIKSLNYWIVFSLVQLFFIGCQFIPSKIASLVSGYYMGFTFYYFLISLVIDITKLFGIKAIGIEIAKVVITVIVMIIGIVTLKNIHINTYEVNVNKDIEDINIVMFSDIHLGYLIGEKEVIEIVSKVNNLDPDLILIPGDFFDGAFSKTASINNVKDNLRKLKSKYGVYVSLGNHDLTKDRENVKKFFEDCDIILLEDESITINDSVTIVGRMDASPIDGFKQKRMPMKELVSSIDSDNLIIVMDHQPKEIDEAIEENVDLIVSGHTHKGQVFPGELVTNILFKVDYGYEKFNNTNVVVTSGVGYWGIPLRVGTKSEIVNIKLSGNK